MNKKKIVCFTGAGLDKESGILTFRDVKTGLWMNYNIDDVCTPAGWRKDREKVLNFYNERRRELPNVQPNEAHKALFKLEEFFDVTHITQNVSDLLERSGCTTVYHLHGELTKARGAMYHHKVSPADPIIDVGYNDIKIGDKCPTTDSQLRPHVVFFEEYPFNIIESYYALEHADVLLIIGTSLEITYTISMLASVNKKANIYYIDPNPSTNLQSANLPIEFIKEPATIGVPKIVDELIKNNIEIKE